MSDELKWGCLVIGSITLVSLGLVATCNHQKQIDLKAPIVETCIKHPVTRSPLMGPHSAQ